MTIQELGSLGEFVAAMGTLVTLVYLAIQIRKNTAAVRANSHQAISDSFIGLNEWIARDPEVARIFRLGMSNLDNLSDDERIRFGFMLLAVLHAYETTYYQYRVGTLDEQLFDSIARDMTVVMTYPGVKQWWDETPFSFSDEFREFLKSRTGTQVMAAH